MIFVHRSHLLLFLLFLSTSFLHAQERSEISRFEEYLATASVKVDEETFISNLGYFLSYEGFLVNYDGDKKKHEIKWYQGSLTTKKGEVFTDLQLKFNTVNNSLYVKNNEQVYKISQFRLSNFTLIENDKERKFSKGFIIPLTTDLSIEFEMKAPEFLKFLMAYENFDELEIVTLTLGSQDQLGRIDIEINESTSVDVSALKSYLFSRKGIKNVKLDAESNDTSVNTFFEVLKDYGNFSLLRWNSKRLSSLDAIALAETSNVPVFKEETYFFSNEKNEIQKFIFARKSIQSGLQFVGITETRSIPSFPNEKKLMHWLKENID